MNNVLAPSQYTTLLVGDATPTAQAPFDTTITWPKVNVGGINYPASGCAAFVSASGGLILPRLTQAQITALPLPGQQLISGTQLFNTTTNALTIYDGAAWQPVGGGGGGTVTQFSVTLSSAQIMSMFATPILLLAAPGAGIAIAPSSVALNYTNGGTNYSGGGTVRVTYGNPAGAYVVSFGANQIQAGTSSYNYFPGALTQGSAPTFANKGIYITNDTIPFAAGNGTLTITILYSMTPSI